MPIHTKEYAPGVIWQTFSKSWTAEELVASRKEEVRIAERCGGVVDVVADLSNVDRFPFDVYQSVFQFLELDWSIVGFWVVITHNRLIRSFTMKIVQSTSLRNRVYFVNSAEEAMSVLHRKRAERQHGVNSAQGF